MVVILWHFFAMFLGYTVKGWHFIIFLIVFFGLVYLIIKYLDKWDQKRDKNKKEDNTAEATVVIEKDTKRQENLFIADELKKLNELRKQGIITDKEFKDQKQRLLSYK